MPQEKKGLVRKFSAGGALYQFLDSSQLRWLLIKPLGTERWQLPKGEMETGENAQQSAEREVLEETGIKGRSLQKIDTVKFFKTVIFFLLEYESGKPEVTQESAKEIIVTSRLFT